MCSTLTLHSLSIFQPFILPYETYGESTESRIVHRNNKHTVFFRVIFLDSFVIFKLDRKFLNLLVISGIFNLDHKLLYIFIISALHKCEMPRWNAQETNLIAEIRQRPSLKDKLLSRPQYPEVVGDRKILR